MRKLCLASLLPLFGSCLFLLAAPQQTDKPYNPRVAPASDEGVKALKRIRMPQGMKLDLFAAEPLLANPVAFSIDEKGRFFVAETFRLHAGVTDNRSHGYWLEDELACRSVADRVAMYRKHLKGKFKDYEKDHDRVRLVADTDGDGKADKSFVFADGFNKAADGLGSGVLARHGNVYYTCIPDLWLLRDTKGTGTADVKQSLATGFGVHVAFIGHDLHGLRMGPDGRLYFTCGDRGLNVKTREGKTLFYPDTGAVLRCDPDGSNLEVVAWGLRNPQELAFDDLGNLFTVDNNSDAGDRARLVHIVEGGDSGWRMGYQYGSAFHDDKSKQGNRGPWHTEKLWHLKHDGQPAYILPPLAHFTSGPSGLCWYPGVGLPKKYAQRFFVCDFRGDAGNSGVLAFGVTPKGATFELDRPEQFLWSVLATDCDFGPDCNFYVSDWVQGWGLTGKGRIYKLSDPESQKKPLAAEVKKLLADGFDGRSLEGLVKLLEHQHQQVRLEAQYAIAARGKPALAVLTKVANESTSRLGRIHALWALGQVGRKEAKAFDGVLPLLTAKDSELRAQAARVLGESTRRSDLKALSILTRDAEPRVRFFAAQALGRVAAAQDETFQALARADLERVLRTNTDGDSYLRHAAVAGLGRLPLVIRDVDLAPENPVAVRLGLLLALRRQGNPEAGKFLHDPEPAIVAEAARAIYDEVITDAMDDLAALVDGSPASERILRQLLQAAKPTDPKQNTFDLFPVLFRALNANLRQGQPKHLQALAALAARAEIPEVIRREALRLLAEGVSPAGRDRVTGLHRPRKAIPAKLAGDAFRGVMARLFTGPMRTEATTTANKLGIQEAGPTLFKMVTDTTITVPARVEALTALDAIRATSTMEAIELALQDGEPALRLEARRLLAGRDPARTVKLLEVVLAEDEKVPASFTPAMKARATVEARQSALALLGGISSPDGQRLLERWVGRLLAKEVPAELQLDVLESGKKLTARDIRQKLEHFEKDRPAKDELAPYRGMLEGGSIQRGERIFYHRAEVSCLRCHKIKGEGGEVGPDLAGIAGKQKREYLLEALVAPSKTIAKGYETAVITTTKGKTIVGIVKMEDADRVRLMTAEGQLVTVAKSDIEERQAGKSAMPDDLLKHLNRFELRDLIEFLASLK